MTKLTILRGISGSGKSTFTTTSLAKVVSRDAIRIGIFGVEFDPSIENDVTLVEHAMIAAYLKAGYDVISDNTNIEWKFVKAIAKIGYRYGAEVELKVFDVPLKDAKRNNDHRAMLGGRHVPHEVIERQHSRFQSTKNNTLDAVDPVIAYNGTPGKPKAFLYDLDGTVYHMNNKRGPYDHNVDVDDPDHVVQEIVNSLSMTYTAIAMSGRKTATRENTLKAMRRDGLYFDNLYMRADGDDRADNIIKQELFNTHVRDNFDVQFVLDDRDQVVEMWRRMGLKCLQVQPGDF